MAEHAFGLNLLTLIHGCSFVLRSFKHVNKQMEELCFDFLETPHEIAGLYDMLGYITYRSTIAS